MKQRVVAKCAKIKRYERSITQYRQNCSFKTHQKNVYKDSHGETRDEVVIPNAEESREFWNGIWGESKDSSRIETQNDFKTN